MPKVKGPGGLGQFDLGTATQDVRAATPRIQRQSGGSYQGNVVTPQDIARGQRIISQRNKAQRSKGRTKSRGKRK